MRRLFIWTSRAEIESRYESRPTRFLLGNFATVADTLTDAEVVTLDRVVSCYPDAEALLHGAASRTADCSRSATPAIVRTCGLLTALQNFWRRRLRGSPFRTFVHPPERMGAVLEAAGLVRVARQGTFIWVLDLYRRREDV